MTGTVVPIREPRVLMRDDSAAHQIRISLAPGGWLAVGCCCPAGTLETRPRWDPEDGLAVYHKHLADEGAL